MLVHEVAPEGVQQPVGALIGVFNKYLNLLKQNIVRFIFLLVLKLYHIEFMRDIFP